MKPREESFGKFCLKDDLSFGLSRSFGERMREHSYLKDGKGFALDGDQKRYLRDRDIDIEHIRIECSFDLKQKKVLAKTTLTLKALKEGAKTVKLDCDDTDISTVTSGTKKLSFEHSGGVLVVDLENPLELEEKSVICVEYVSQPRFGIYFTGPDQGYPDKDTQIWTQGQDSDNHYWFPCIDEPKGRITSEVICTVASDWSVISNGRLLESKDNKDGTKTWHWLQDKPHAVYLVTLVAGPFERSVLKKSGPPIDIFYKAGQKEDAERTFENTSKILDLFGKVTDEPYPWDKYTQVAVQDFIFGGMENTSATTQTDLVIHDAKAHLDYSADFLVAHEAAHQWFGDLITCREWPHAWLNEGFATFFEALWMEHHKGKDEYEAELKDFISSYLQEHYKRPIVCRDFSLPIDIFDRHLYEKGGIVLHMLRKELSDGVFFGALKHYVKTNKGRNVRTMDLLEAIESYSGRELEWFFEQWVMRAGQADFEVEYNFDEKEKIGSVSIKQTQKEEAYLGSVKLAFLFDSSTEVVDAKIDSKNVQITTKLEKQPKGVVFDSGYGMLKTLKFKRPLDMLLFQLNSAPHVLDRIEAAEELASSSSLKAVEGLADKLSSNDHWSVLVASASAIGSIKGQRALDVLIKNRFHQNLKVQKGVAEALGKFYLSTEAFDALKDIFNKRSSYIVCGAAAAAIGETQVDKAFDFLKEAIEVDSHMEFIRRGAIMGLTHLQSSKARDLVSVWTKWGKPQQARSTATSALGYLGEGHTKTVNTLIRLLDDEWFLVRRAAVGALDRMQAKEALPKLTKIGDFDPNGRVARDAKYAVRSISKSLTTSKRFGELTKRINDLEKNLRTLEEQTLKANAKKK